MADISQTSTSVIAGSNAKRIFKVCGGTVSAGQPVYLDGSGTVQRADANASATTATVLGIAEQSGAIGQRISILTEDDDLTIGATVAIGDVLIASSTAGGIAPVADLASGWYCTVLGVAKSTTKIRFLPVAAGAAKA